jgi:hypothetical protein
MERRILDALLNLSANSACIALPAKAELNCINRAACNPRLSFTSLHHSGGLRVALFKVLDRESRVVLKAAETIVH